MNDEQLSAQEFGAAFKGFLEQAATGVPKEEPVFARRIREHLGVDPTPLPILSQLFASTDRPNVQVALDSLLQKEGRSFEALGLASQHIGFTGASLSNLLVPESTGFFGQSAPTVAPVKYVQIELGDGSTLACIETAVLFATTDDGPLVGLIWSGADNSIHRGKIELQVMAPGREVAERFLTQVRDEVLARNVYRGRVISLERSQHHETTIKFHRLPKVERDEIILPGGVLERVEAHSIVFARHIERLRASRRHLRRGLLLHVPPGTGKTMTATYVIGQLPGRTAVLLTGAALSMIEQSVALARMLEPSMVVLEDVDLIAEERTRQEGNQNAVLFELLNQMDGLTEDADIIFMLTTNRPDLLEPALAARPGRIDQAIEIPLPDASCRRRLFDLYADGLQLELADVERFVERTRGVSPAFIRELLRKAALFAAVESTNGLVVRDQNLDEALHDLVIEGGELTKTLLGGAPAPVT
jgi:AAA+ superfamily predicted ATPase